MRFGLHQPSESGKMQSGVLEETTAIAQQAHAMCDTFAEMTVMTACQSATVLLGWLPVCTCMP